MLLIPCFCLLLCAAAAPHLSQAMCLKLKAKLSQKTVAELQTPQMQWTFWELTAWACGAAYLAKHDYDITTSRIISTAMIHCCLLLQLFRTHDIGPGEVSACMFLTGTVLQALASLHPSEQDLAHPLFADAQQDQLKTTIAAILLKVLEHKKTLPTSGVGAGSLSLLHGVVHLMRALPDDMQDFYQDACTTLVSWPAKPHEVMNSLFHALSGYRAARDVSPVRPPAAGRGRGGRRGRGARRGRGRRRAASDSDSDYSS